MLARTVYKNLKQKKGMIR